MQSALIHLDIVIHKLNVLQFPRDLEEEKQFQKIDGWMDVVLY